MKNIKLMSLAAFTSFAFVACNGDHGTSNGKDTQANSYHVSADSAKMDTAKVTDGSSLDNGGSGGTKIAKDTSKMIKK